MAKMERAETFPPDSLETFFKLIVNTYRIKPLGEVATELFRSARQGKRTPREYLVHLEELQLDIDIDATVDEKISPELLYYKFKTTLWKDIQDELQTMIAKEKLNPGGPQRDISTIDLLLPVVEFIHDHLPMKDKEKSDPRPPRQPAEREVAKRGRRTRSGRLDRTPVQLGPRYPTGTCRRKGRRA